MNYIYDSACVNRLIKISEELYLKYMDIIDVEYGSENFYKLIGELTRLSNIEDNILLSLPKAGRLIDDINNFIMQNYSCDDNLMHTFVLNRINSNMCNLCALAEASELSNTINDDIVDSQYTINSINDDLYLSYILRLNNVLNKTSNIEKKREIRFIQLAYIFSFKNISDAFIGNNLCLDSELIKEFDNTFNDIDSYNSFMYLKNNIAFNLCESLLMKNITLSNYYNAKNENLICFSNLLLFKSLLQDINDSDFIEIKNSFMIDFQDYNKDNYIINKLKKCFDIEYNYRFSNKANKSRQVLDASVISNLISLLKVEDTLYDKFMDLKLDGFDNFNVISSLIDFESGFIDDLDVNSENISIILSVIYRDLGFFVDVYNNSFKKNAIVQRLKNIIPYFRKVEVANGVLEKNYDSIMSNHIVDSLKMFSGDLSIIKSYIFMYPNLSNDLVLLNGNYSLIDRFSDDITSVSLGNNDVFEYCYDKSEQLYKLYSVIIDDLFRYSDKYESEWIDLFNFKICELSDIIDSVSDEHLFQIKDEILAFDDGMIKEKVLSLLNNKVH